MRRLPLALVLLAAPAIAALGPRYGGDLRVGLLDLPALSEPGVPRSREDRLVAGLLHETLVGTGTDGLPVPGLARGWTVTASGREWTLTLPAGLVFHDERPVGAEDAARSVRRFLRSGSRAAARLAESLDGGASYRTGAAPDVAGLAAPDPLHVVLRLVEERPLPLAPLAARAAAITSSAGAGCGPFVPTVATPGRWSLTAFGAHVRGRPYLDRLQLVAAADRAALGADLASGRVDAAPGEPGVSSLAGTLLLVLDPSRPPFHRPDARAAVDAGLDRADLVRHFLPGGDAAPSLLVPGLLPPLGLGPPAPGAARSGRITLVVAQDVPPRVSQRVVAHLGAAGLEVAVSALPPAEALKTPAQARLLLWSPEVPEAGLALAEMAALAPPVDAAEQALLAAARERNLDRRRVLLHRAEAALRENRVLVPLASAPVSVGVRPGLHGVSVDLGGRVLLEDAWLEP
ncbi:MAG: hypothetical protein HY317_01300 [Acidobacteria bacterium]|nr:hypothetical protein [Acidobacteriota bacterium]